MKIIILDSDPFSSQHVQQAIEKNGLSRFCDVAAELTAPEPDNAYIWVGSEKDAPPADLDLKQQDQFMRPLRIGALLERIHRHISSQDQQALNETIQIGPYMLNRINNELIDQQSGETIRLTDKETHILALLASQDDKFVDRETLLDEVWGYAKNVETHTLETHIYRLRQKIEKDPSDPQILITDESGYKLSV